MCGCRYSVCVQCTCTHVCEHTLTRTRTHTHTHTHTRTHVHTHTYAHTYAHRPDEVVIPKEDAIVQEISEVLRDWSIIWKRLYTVRMTYMNPSPPSPKCVRGAYCSPVARSLLPQFVRRAFCPQWGHNLGEPTAPPPPPRCVREPNPPSGSRPPREPTIPLCTP